MQASTTRDAEGNVVEFASALDLWAGEGLQVLKEIARTYGAYITYEALAELLQSRSRVRTGVPFRHWIGKVLGKIARLQQLAPNEPILTSLVVRADGTIGDGYVIPLRERGIEPPNDLDEASAVERLLCYRYFGADLPEDGGRPQLTEKVALQRAKRVPPKAGTRRVCGICFVELPIAGVCGICGDTS